MTKTELLLTTSYNIKQTSDENKEKYQLWDYLLIQYQILQTNIMRIIWQTVRRITNEILGVKGLTGTKPYFKIKIGTIEKQFVASQPVHFVSLADSFLYCFQNPHLKWKLEQFHGPVKLPVLSRKGPRSQLFEVWIMPYTR